MTKHCLGLALLLAVAPAAAETHVDVNCDVESDYDFTLTDRSVVFTRDSGTPRAIVMRGGRLFIDDRWVAVSAADSKRIADYEREARAVMPLAQQVGRDAADIAFTVIGEVATGFSSDPAATRVRLGEARKQLDARLAQSVSATHYSGDDLGKGIGEAVRDVMPMVVGDIVGGAVRAALGGDTARLQNMQDMDKDIEARIKPRAEALERKAEGLCMRMQALDRIDDALEYRLPDGKPLGLLEVESGRRTRRD